MRNREFPFTGSTQEGRRVCRNNYKRHMDNNGRGGLEMGGRWGGLGISRGWGEKAENCIWITIKLENKLKKIKLKKKRYQQMWYRACSVLDGYLLITWVISWPNKAKRADKDNAPYALLSTVLTISPQEFRVIWPTFLWISPHVSLVQWDGE